MKWNTFLIGLILLFYISVAPAQILRIYGIHMRSSNPEALMIIEDDEDYPVRVIFPKHKTTLNLESGQILTVVYNSKKQKYLVTDISKRGSFAYIWVEPIQNKNGQ